MALQRVRDHHEEAGLGADDVLEHTTQRPLALGRRVVHFAIRPDQHGLEIAIRRVVLRQDALRRRDRRLRGPLRRRDRGQLAQFLVGSEEREPHPFGVVGVPGPGAL